MRSSAYFVELTNWRYESRSLVIYETTLNIPAEVRPMSLAIINNSTMHEVIGVKEHYVLWAIVACGCQPESKLRSLINPDPQEFIICFNWRLRRNEIADAIIRNRVRRQLIADYNYTEIPVCLIAY